MANYCGFIFFWKATYVIFFRYLQIGQLHLCTHRVFFLAITNCETYGAFTFHVKSVINENLGGILGGTQCLMVNNLMLSEC